ncbi:MAG TPA: ABC transporter permease [Gemmatimonadaceae bacterium]|nr:ABC transporter permease [Gemmatimonadaceae bacterium]
MSTMLQDLKYGVRALIRSRGVTLVAILTVALGLGANIALFTLFNAVLLRSAPGVTEAHRLVWLTPVSRQGRSLQLSYPAYLDYRDSSEVFDGLAAYSSVPLSMSGVGEPERIDGQIVSGNFFELLGVRPVLGRTFVAAEDRRAGADAVVVIGHTLWQRTFAGDPGVLGRSVTINGHPFTIIGVTPPGFNGPEVGTPREAWVTLAMQAQAAPLLDDALTRRGTWWLRAFGRLAPEVNRDRAEAALQVIAMRQSADDPEQLGDVRVRLSPMRGGLSPADGGDMIPVGILAAAVTAVILVIACANVANLLLARAVARRREMGVRLALGAGRVRLVRQLLTESVVLATVASAVGVLLSTWFIDGIMLFLDIPPTIDTVLDGRVLGFAVGAALVTGVGFGLAPALQATRRDLISSLKDDTIGRGTTRSRVQRALVCGQVALSVVLLVTTGLFLRSLQKASAVEIGFDARANVALVSFDLRLQGYSDEQASLAYDQLLARVRALPGIEAATLADLIPLGGRMIGSGVVIEGEPGTDGPSRSAGLATVRSDYFRTLGLPLLRGRDFAATDGAGATPVAIVNETFTRRYWPGEDPLGKRLSLDGEDGPFLEVIGVARDSKYDAVSEDPRPFVYVPQTQRPSYLTDITLMARTNGIGVSLLAALERELRALEPGIPIFRRTTMHTVVADAGASRRQGSQLLSAFGAVAMLLASVGLYGVMSYAVSQRTREIGLRAALGAARRDLIMMFVGEGTRLALLGIAVGLAAAAGIAQLMAGMLYGIGATDAATFGIVAVLLVAVALVASYLPARRAARVDPTVSLRYE